MNKQGRNKIKKTPISINICVLGDDNEKNRQWILDYGHASEYESKNNSIKLNKKILTFSFDIHFVFCDQAEEKIVSCVQESNCIIILFDLGHRPSFDNILEKWLVWVRDVCKYEKNIILLGDFISLQSDNEDLFLTASEEEVDEVIKLSELSQILFLRIGNLSKTEKIAKIDEQLIDLLPQNEFNSKDQDNGKSFGVRCFIF